MKPQKQQTTIRVPSLGELFGGNLEEAFAQEELNLLLNREPNPKWVKEHPFIKGHRYIPIDKVEFMLRMIFKRYRIEITGQGTSFDGVWVTVRVHYLNPTTMEMDYHDGIGAVQLQLRAQTKDEKDRNEKVVFCVENVNKGAISMAFPIAKTLAIKDACDHFGALFGCNLNRKDVATHVMDSSLSPVTEEDLKELFELKKDVIPPDQVIHIERIIKQKEVKSYKKAQTILQSA